MEILKILGIIVLIIISIFIIWIVYLFIYFLFNPKDEAKDEAKAEDEAEDEAEDDDELLWCCSIDGKKIKSDEYDKYISDGHRELVYVDGGKYIGDVKDGYRHGKGKYNHANGEIYIGDYKDGWRHGKGITEYPDGGKIVGEWKNDEPNGYAVISMPDGVIKYEGYLKDFLHHGKGIARFNNGDVYEGEWNMGEREGKGVYTWENGQKYDGEWFDGDKHGIGTEYYNDNSCWKGEWIKGERFKGKWLKRGLDNSEEKSPKTVPQDRDRISIEDSEWSGNGSGIFISKNGYLATNNHVIHNASKISAEFIYNNEIETFNLKIIRTDDANDLAILKIEDKKFKGFKSLPYSIKRTTCDIGAEVYALGYPMALSILGKDLKFTDGKISAKSGFQGDIRVYQTTVPIQGGNSGGPLFDSNGNLVGINSSKIRQEVADNVSYAIKSDYLIAFINALPQKIPIPNSRALNGKRYTEQVKILGGFVPLIKVVD